MAKVYSKTSFYDSIEKNINFFIYSLQYNSEISLILNNFVYVIYDIFLLFKDVFLDVMYHSNSEYN